MRLHFGVGVSWVMDLGGRAGSSGDRLAPGPWSLGLRAALSCDSCMASGEGQGNHLLQREWWPAGGEEEEELSG